MCTISYIPISTKSNGFIVTDNRDESMNRPAELPKMYYEYNAQLFYPKDKRAGGTWIGASNNKSLICLMNGAFSKHERKATYRKSRGIVVKDLLAAKNLLPAIESYVFKGIEPFFALLFMWKKSIEVYELIWDGLKIHVHKRDSAEPAIWSAAMTYTGEEQKEKEIRFTTFLKQHKNKEIISQLVWDFHHNKGNEKEEGFIIDRGELRTTSISQFQHTSDGSSYFRFENLITGEQQQDEIIWPSY